jgi:hypothetical protein
MSEIKENVFNIVTSCNKVDLFYILGVNEQFQLKPTGDAGFNASNIFSTLLISYTVLPH